MRAIQSVLGLFWVAIGWLLVGLLNFRFLWDHTLPAPLPTLVMVIWLMEGPLWLALYIGWRIRRSEEASRLEELDRRNQMKLQGFEGRRRSSPSLPG